MKSIRNLFGHVRYACHAPDFKTMLEIVWLALHGCTGADNVHEIAEKCLPWYWRDATVKEWLIFYKALLRYRLIHNRVFYRCDFCRRPLKIFGRFVFHKKLCPPF